MSDLSQATSQSTLPLASHDAPQEPPPEITGFAGLEQAAFAAADRAGVRVVTLHGSGEVRRILPLVAGIWGDTLTPPPDLLQALSHAGGTLLVAEEVSTGDAVGFACGFLGWSDGLHLHSHQVGVVEKVRRRGVGYALKLAQACMCERHGVQELRWTFDPLMTRNAKFNFIQVGVEALAFLPEFYGVMTDNENSGDLSDRLWVRWRPLERRRADARHDGYPLLVDEAGVVRRTTARVQRGASIPIPAHYRALRRSDPAAARAWRLAVRECMTEAFERGLTVTDFRDGSYVLDTSRARSSPLTGSHDQIGNKEA